MVAVVIGADFSIMFFNRPKILWEVKPIVNSLKMIVEN
jgi:hypothetical protein